MQSDNAGKGGGQNRESQPQGIEVPKSDGDVEDCWPVMVQLRPHVKLEDFKAAVRRQAQEGYRLAFIRREGKVAGVAGFRILHNLAWGRFCYVDDLVTDELARSQGLGAALMKWLYEFAKSEGCQRLELDSGVQRFAAHRFYFEQRMSISCYHFSHVTGSANPRQLLA